MQAANEVYQFLNELDIPFRIHKHPPVKSVDEALNYWKNIDATHCKNLFLRNQKGNRHYLYITFHDKVIGIKDLQEKIGSGKLSFASERRLEKYLGLEKGAVSPFGLLNDTDDHVLVYIDEGLKSSKQIAFHPNVNHATIQLSFEDFIRFLEKVGNQYQFLPI